jgi:roadblock/LC7 domain-containing protein
MYSNTFYNQYARDVFSQNGEDGIVEELLKRLDINSGYVCEFGAWDGIYLSNTFNLIQKGFKGVFIEGDKDKFQDLLKTCKNYPNIIPINAYVDYEGENTLDNILQKTDIPFDFELLSIDIDSFDYHVWRSLKLYRPKIVIIEINSGINTNNEEHIHTPDKYQGTAFRPTFNLGIEKGYKFVCHTGNMIFVRNDLFDKLNVHYNHELENFRTIWGAY